MSRRAATAGRPRGRWSGWLLRAGLGAALLAALLGSGRLDPSALASVRPGPWLAVLGAACFLALALNSLRWACLARAAGIPIAGATAVRVALASNVFLFVSPAGTGADAARVLHLVRAEGERTGRALALGIVDRLIGVQTLLAVAAAVGVAAALGRPALWGAAAGLGAAAIGATLVVSGIALPATRRLCLRLLPTPWRERLQAAAVPWHPAWVAGVLGLSLAGAAANLALPVLGLAALGHPTGGPQALFGSAMVVLVNTVAPTPGGLGAGEAAASAMLQGARGASAMLLARVLLVAWSLALGAGYLAHGSREVEPKEAGRGAVA
ncbi:MAG: flippase-like domain-containing protein [Chthonomonadales bacterium]|nr:flippase-like domain-containing protein [Chthonomonadales bacterium]